MSFLKSILETIYGLSINILLWQIFHLLMTLWEKKYKRESQRECFFANFQVCPLVEVSSAFLKKCDEGVVPDKLPIPLSF